MRLAHLWLTDFRNYEQAALSPAPGLTAVVGDNGQGKTNLLEAVGYLATLDSFRGTPAEALVRVGHEQAVVRAEVEADGRTSLIEAVLARGGRDRVLVNRQPLRRTRDLLGTVRVTVFSPDDLVLVKGGPVERRRLLDDTIVACVPRHDVTRSDLARLLRHRGGLLQRAGGRLDSEVAATLDVWGTKLADIGEILSRARERLVERLGPVVTMAYGQVAGAPADVQLRYEAPWRDEAVWRRPLADARDHRRPPRGQHGRSTP